MATKFERYRINAHELLDALLEGRLVHTIYVAGSGNKELNLGPLRDAIVKAYNIKPINPPDKLIEVLGRQYRLEDILKLKEVE